MIPSYAIVLCIEIHIRQRSTKIVDIPICSLNYLEDHRAEDNYDQSELRTLPGEPGGGREAAPLYGTEWTALLRLILGSISPPISARSPAGHEPRRARSGRRVLQPTRSYI